MARRRHNWVVFLPACQSASLHSDPRMAASVGCCDALSEAQWHTKGPGCLNPSPRISGTLPQHARRLACYVVEPPAALAGTAWTMHPPASSPDAPEDGRCYRAGCRGDVLLAAGRLEHTPPVSAHITPAGRCSGWCPRQTATTSGRRRRRACLHSRRSCSTPSPAASGSRRARRNRPRC